MATKANELDVIVNAVMKALEQKTNDAAVKKPKAKAVKAPVVKQAPANVVKEKPVANKPKSEVQYEEVIRVDVPLGQNAFLRVSVENTSSEVQLLNMRKWYRNASGSEIPTKNGFSIRNSKENVSGIVSALGEVALNNKGN